MNKRKTIISFILTCVILLLGMAVYQMLSNQQKEEMTIVDDKAALRRVKVKQIQSSTAEHQIAIDGRLTAYEKVNLSANVSGILQATSKPLKKGTYVKKGTLLFEIDQEKARYNLYSLRSSLLNAITLIMPDLKIDYPEAHTNWKKYLDDFEIEHAVQALPKITNDQEKYFVVSRNILTIYYNIKSAEAQLEDYKIYAPFSGIITQANVFPGTLVMPGQALAQMINADNYELEAPITESDLPAIKIGNKVELNTSASDKNWIGKVARISNQVDPTTQNILVYISVSGSGLKEGMYLNGRINGLPLQDVVAIPKDFIVNQEYVYVVRDSMVQLQKLELKNRDADFVFAKEFDAAAWVVYEDPRGLFEGQKVEVRN